MLFIEVDRGFEGLSGLWRAPELDQSRGAFASILYCICSKCFLRNKVCTSKAHRGGTNMNRSEPIDIVNTKFALGEKFTMFSLFTYIFTSTSSKSYASKQTVTKIGVSGLALEFSFKRSGFEGFWYLLFELHSLEKLTVKRSKMIAENIEKQNINLELVDMKFSLWRSALRVIIFLKIALYTHMWEFALSKRNIFK